MRWKLDSVGRPVTVQVAVTRRCPDAAPRRRRLDCIVDSNNGLCERGGWREEGEERRAERGGRREEGGEQVKESREHATEAEVAGEKVTESECSELVECVWDSGCAPEVICRECKLRASNLN